MRPLFYSFNPQTQEVTAHHDIESYAAVIVEQDDSERILAHTTINDSLISTVFLGIDYNCNGNIPLLFETMVFGGLLDGEQQRYTTYEQAMLGHHEMMQKALILLSVQEDTTP